MKKTQVFSYILESELTKGLFIHYVIQVGCIGVVDQNMTQEIKINTYMHFSSYRQFCHKSVVHKIKVDGYLNVKNAGKCSLLTLKNFCFNL